MQPRRSTGFTSLGRAAFVFFGWVIELPRTAFRIATAGALLAAVALGARGYVRSGDWLLPEIFYTRTIASAG